MSAEKLEAQIKYVFDGIKNGTVKEYDLSITEARAGHYIINCDLYGTQKEFITHRVPKAYRPGISFKVDSQRGTAMITRMEFKEEYAPIKTQFMQNLEDMLRKEGIVVITIDEPNPENCEFWIQRAYNSTCETRFYRKTI